MPRLSRRVPTPLCACGDRCTPGIGPETTIALATASTGTTMVVWGVKGQLRSATLLADGQTWSAPTTIASGSAIVDGLRLVPSQDGSVALLWLGIPKLDPKLQSSCRGRRVRISRFDSSGSWSDPKTLTTEAAERNSCTYDVELKDDQIIIGLVGIGHVRMLAVDPRSLARLWSRTLPTSNTRLTSNPNVRSEARNGRRAVVEPILADRLVAGVNYERMAVHIRVVDETRR
jgi:hypothetical protein